MKYSVWANFYILSFKHVLVEQHERNHVGQILTMIMNYAIPLLFNAEQCTVHNLFCNLRYQFSDIIRGTADSTVYSDFRPKC
jgi:hypothetical protein